MQIQVEQTTTGFKVRALGTTKTGRTTSKVIGRAKTYDEVDTIVSQYEAAQPQVRTEVMV